MCVYLDLYGHLTVYSQQVGEWLTPREWYGLNDGPPPCYTVRGIFSSDGRFTVNQYKVYLSGHFYPMVKHFYPDGSGLCQDDDAQIIRARRLTV